MQFVWELICNYKDVIFLFGGVLFPLLLCSQEIVPPLWEAVKLERNPCSEDNLLVFLV